MNILIDLQHPAHLHFFKNLISLLKNEGHNILLTGRDKDILVELCKEINQDIEVFGVAKKGVINLGKELFYRQNILLKHINRFKPDVMLAIAGTFISSLGWLKRIPTYVFYDTEHATISNLLSYPFCKCVYVPQCYRKKIFWNHVRYSSYHELAYLHPNYFTPDQNILNKVGLKQDEKFTFIRFVNWGAAHDIGANGFTLENKINAVKRFSKYGSVFISSESEIPDELKKHELNIPKSMIHDFMSFASLIFGESATMVSEGAVLGVPGVYIDPTGRGYTDEQEKEYKIVNWFTSINQNEAITKGEEILKNYNRDKYKKIQNRILEEKIDLTSFMHDLILKTGTI